jgi:hypothetical protein
MHRVGLVLSICGTYTNHPVRKRREEESAEMKYSREVISFLYGGVA